jgi:thiol peroxidase
MSTTTTCSQRHGAVTFKGDPLTLVGDELKVGEAAPAFSLVANDLSAKTLADYAGKVAVIITVPSLDTPVCDTETRRFNEEAAALGDGVRVLAVSLDLPFAQKRWCGAAGVERVETLSDYKEGAFGPAYGLLIKELGLLARAVIVVDGSGAIRHFELVKEVTAEPDYDAALRAAKAAR